MKRTVPGLLVLLLALSACRAMGGAPPDPSDDDVGIEHPTGAEPIFMIDWQGGFVPVQYMATRTPAFVLYGDGRWSTRARPFLRSCSAR